MVETKGYNVLPYPLYIRIQVFQIPLYRAWKDLFKKYPLPLRLMKFVIITVNQKR